MKICNFWYTQYTRYSVYYVKPRRSLARIITVSKCPAQGMTMFPRRRNILLAVSKSATAAFSLPFLHFPLPSPYRICALKICVRRQSAKHTWFDTFCKTRKKDRVCLYL